MKAAVYASKVLVVLVSWLKHLRRRYASMVLVRLRFLSRLGAEARPDIQQISCMARVFPVRARCQTIKPIPNLHNLHSITQMTNQVGQHLKLDLTLHKRRQIVKGYDPTFLFVLFYLFFLCTNTSPTIQMR